MEDENDVETPDAETPAAETPETPAADTPVVPANVLEQLGADADFVRDADELLKAGPPQIDAKSLTMEQRLVLLNLYNSTREVEAKGAEARAAEKAGVDQKAAEVEAARLQQLEEQAKQTDAMSALDKLIADLKASTAKPLPETIDPLSDEALDARIAKKADERLLAIFEKQKQEATAAQQQRQAASADAQRATAVNARNAEIRAFVNSHDEFDDPEFVADLDKAFREFNPGDPKAKGYTVRVPIEKVFRLVQAERGVAATAQEQDQARRTVKRDGTVVGPTVPKFRSEAERTEWLIRNPKEAQRLHDELVSR